MRRLGSVDVSAEGKHVVSMAAAPGGRAWVERSANEGCGREIVDTAAVGSPFAGGEPEVSFDGKQLASTRSSTGDTCRHDTLVVRPIAGGNERTWLLPDSAQIGMSVIRLAWGPSNRYIAFTVSTGEGFFVRLLDLDLHRDLTAATEVVVQSPDALPSVAFAGTTLVIQKAGGAIVTYGKGTTLVAAPKSAFTRIDFDVTGRYLLAVLANNGAWQYRVGSGAGAPPAPATPSTPTGSPKNLRVGVR